jgi:hypothetical protein
MTRIANEIADAMLYAAMLAGEDGARQALDNALDAYGDLPRVTLVCIEQRAIEAYRAASL